MKKYFIAEFLFLIICTLDVFSQQESSNASFPVVSHSIEKNTQIRQITAVGYLQPSRSLVLLSPFQGRVSKIWVKEGQAVKKGTSLVSIERVNTVGTFNQNIISAETTGFVSDILPELGQEINASQEVVRLIQLDYLSLQATLSDKDAYLIREGVPAKVNTGVGVLTGSVTYRQLEPDYTTGLFDMEIHFNLTKNMEVRQWLGRFVQAEIDSIPISGYFVLNDAIVQKGNGLSLWTLNEDNVLFLSPIIPQEIFGDYTLLKEKPEGTIYLSGETDNLVIGESFDPKKQVKTGSSRRRRFKL